MEYVKKAMSGGDKSGSSGDKSGSSGAKTDGGNDYGDTALAYGVKESGQNIDPATQEKITDGVRGMYEKLSGNKVDPKYSN